MASRMGELGVTDDPRGLVLPSLGLHLDPSVGVPRAFVSHVHASRGAGSGEILASPETIAALEAMRGERLANARVIDWDACHELPLATGGSARLTIAPSGHMRGGAQLVVDHPGGRFVYTGDVRAGATAAPRSCSAFAPVPCDELVIEATFALPIFRFPPRAREIDALAAWCRARVHEGESPIVVTREKAEIALELEAHGVTVDVVESAPKTKRSRAPIALASGLALLDAAIEQRRADAAFVLSDHADSDALVAIAIATGARKVTTTHGDATVLAALLAERGVDAVAIERAAIDEGP